MQKLNESIVATAPHQAKLNQSELKGTIFFDLTAAQQARLNEKRNGKAGMVIGSIRSFQDGKTKLVAAILPFEIARKFIEFVNENTGGEPENVETTHETTK